MGYTITEKGTVTIPSEIRKRHSLLKGTQVDFIETDEGVLIVPVVPLEDLLGVDKDREEVIFQMIRELQAEHRREASGEE
jgi:AbrB family looped-hinge helix DNA binding protein